MQKIFSKVYGIELIEVTRSWKEVNIKGKEQWKKTILNLIKRMCSEFAGLIIHLSESVASSSYIERYPEFLDKTGYLRKHPIHILTKIANARQILLITIRLYNANFWIDHKTKSINSLVILELVISVINLPYVKPIVHARIILTSNSVLHSRKP